MAVGGSGIIFVTGVPQPFEPSNNLTLFVPFASDRQLAASRIRGAKRNILLTGLRAYSVMTGSKNAVKSLKYRRVTDLANEFINLIPPPFFLEVTKLPTNKATLIPIPLHPSRYRDRGFNQAEVLGKRIADRLNIPIQTDILRRVKKTTPQVEMKDRKERLQNMKDVFSIHNSQFIIHNSSIILFDDVFTTGATMRAAGETLKRAGANFVWAITMAR